MDSIGASTNIVNNLPALRQEPASTALNEEGQNDSMLMPTKISTKNDLMDLSQLRDLANVEAPQNPPSVTTKTVNLSEIAGPKKLNDQNGADSDLARIADAVLNVVNGLKPGETVVIRYDDNNVTTTKDGPSAWDNIKSASVDIAQTGFRAARSVVEQDPSFAFRESLEVAKNSVERIMPDSQISYTIGDKLYPAMRVVLTAIDIHKAVKTGRDPNQSLMDKLVDYGHVATDIGGLVAIGGGALPGASYLGFAAVLGDIVAGAWHAMRFSAQGLNRLKISEKSEINNEDKTARLSIEIKGGSHVNKVEATNLLSPAAGNLKGGEKVTVVFEPQQVTIAKEGPTTWDKVKKASEDTTRTIFKGARGIVEADPSFIFRESLEISKNSVERILPDMLNPAIAKGLYPVMRAALTGIDIAKAVKTQRDPGQTIADKIIDYGHVATDVGGLMAIGAPMLTAATKIPVPWVGYLATAAIIGDIVAGAWHALRLSTNAANKFMAKQKKENNTPVENKPPQVIVEIKDEKLNAADIKKAD